MKPVIKHILAAMPLAAMLGACNDSYLDQFPETSITETVFFNTVGDLETYTNGLYGNFGSGSYLDDACDNLVDTDGSSRYNLMLGQVDQDRIGNWSWSSIRSVNFMLARCGNVTGDEGEIRHYIGLARLIRAKLYYDMVKSYSDVPWYSRDLSTTDTEELYKTQDPRSLVVDSIMADLDYAVTNMMEGSSKTKIYRQAALAMQARIALHEGTFRKYHPELKLNDGDRFLNIAVEASSKLMNNYGYTLSTASYKGMDAYESLFVTPDLTSNPEMIMVSDYDKVLNRRNNAQAIYAYYGITRSLVEDYLVIDGNTTKRFQDVPGHETMTLNEIFENRDPRMRQTVMYPGFIDVRNNEPYIVDVSKTGYMQSKFLPREADQYGWGMSYNDIPIFRLGEQLLIYAEAKAELGTLTQDDLDRSINLLRRRAGMPDAQLSQWLSDIDPVQAARYPNVTSSQRGAVLEVRRERRIELACEGFRYGDLFRWYAGHLMEQTPEGMYVPGPGLYDYTGDGEPDFGFFMSEQQRDEMCPPSTIQGKKLTIYIMSNTTFGLTEGDHGYIYQTAHKDKFHFEQPKYYYTPLSTYDLTINPNLVQNPYWKLF